jgi:Leucine-rich repeat (LRR) protein
MILNREYLNETYKSSLNSLAGLQLREKQIEHVEKETFTGLVNLYSIDLGQNEIKHLDKDTFSGLINLREIWLNNNQLEQGCTRVEARAAQKKQRGDEIYTCQ